MGRGLSLLYGGSGLAWQKRATCPPECLLPRLLGLRPSRPHVDQPTHAAGVVCDDWTSRKRQRRATVSVADASGSSEKVLHNHGHLLSRIAPLPSSSHRSAMRCSSAAPRPGASRSDTFHLISNWKPGPQSGRRGITPRSGVTRRCGLKENQLAVSREPESSQASASPSQSDYLHFGQETSISPVFVVAVTESGSSALASEDSGSRLTNHWEAFLVDQSPTA